MMRTVDEIDVGAPPATAFRFAADVERWPDILPHYRWVTIRERTSEKSVVEMAAWRPFGRFNWPTWWKSHMWIDEPRMEVRYRHIEGITAGMDVVWRVEPRDAGTRITLIHEWNGPPWFLVRRPAAEWVIGPVFVHGIATRTLAGVAMAAERARG